MGVTCSSSNHKLSKKNEIQLPILIAQNYIDIIGQLQLSDQISDDLRYNLNELIIIRSKLAHCLLRLQIRYSQYRYSELEQELKIVLENIEKLLQLTEFEKHYPQIYQYLNEQIQVHKYTFKQV